MTKPFYVSFVVPGHPFGKQTNRTPKNSFRHFTPTETKAYQKRVGLLAREAMRGQFKQEKNVDLGIMFVAVFPLLSSFTKAERAAALADDIRPTKKPDLSNIQKAIEDGMIGVVYDDDNQITESGGSKKIYGEVPCVKVCVYDRKAFDISVVIKGADFDNALTTKE